MGCPLMLPVRPQKKVSLPAQLSSSVWGRSLLLSSHSSGGSISTKQIPISLQIGEPFLWCQIFSFICLWANRMITFLFLLSIFFIHLSISILCTMSTASSIFASISGLILLRIWITCTLISPPHSVSLLVIHSLFKVDVFLAQLVVSFLKLFYLFHRLELNHCG